MFEPRPGMRVVIRYNDTDMRLADALGEVTALSPSSITVATRRGSVEIERSAIEIIHEVPPPPERSGPLHRIVSATDLRKIATAAWLPSDIAWLNADTIAAEVEGEHDSTNPGIQAGWLLKSSSIGGKRAQTGLPISEPGLDMAQTLTLWQHWYHKRGLAPGLELYTAGDDQDLAEPCRNIARHIHSEDISRQLVYKAMTADTHKITRQGSWREPPPRMTIDMGDKPTATHFAIAGLPQTELAYRLLKNPAYQIFFMVATAHHPDGQQTPVGVLRLSTVNKWAFLDCLAVNPSARRRGVASTLVAAAASHASTLGIRSMLAEVPPRNHVAEALLRSLTFSVHHRFWYAYADMQE